MKSIPSDRFFLALMGGLAFIFSYAVSWSQGKEALACLEDAAISCLFMGFLTQKILHFLNDHLLRYFQENKGKSLEKKRDKK